MPVSPEYVRLQVLLRAARRNDKGVGDAEQALRALGLEVTGTGKASISARATPETFGTVFGKDRDADLQVPATLADYVESVTIAPQHITMDDTPSSDKNKRRGKP